MKKILLTLILGLQLSLFVSAQINYPITRKVNQVDTVFKHILYDPYRWLENTKSPEVMDWLKAQQKFTNNTLENLTGIDSFLNELNEYNIQKTYWRNRLFTCGNAQYYFKQNRNQLNTQVYFKYDKDTTEHLFFDTWTIHPNKRYQLAYIKPSPDNKYILAAFDEKGEEYPFIKLYSTAAKTWLPDSISHCYGNSISWDAESKGFIYGMNASDDRFDPANLNKDIYKYHRLNAGYSNDNVVIDSVQRIKAEPKISDSYYATLFNNESKNKIYFQPNTGFEFDFTNVYYSNTTNLSTTPSSWELLYSSKDSVSTVNGKPFIETASAYYFISAKGKGFKSLRKTVTTNPDFSAAKIIFPEDKIWQLEAIKETKSYIIAQYSKYGFIDKYIVIDKQTDKVVQLKSIELYKNYDISPFDKETDECSFNIFGINRPRRSFVLDINKDKIVSNPFWAIQNQTLLSGYENIISEVVEVPSYDGTLIPMSILRDKNTKLDGNNICLLYGYGAYGIQVKDNNYNSYSPANNLLAKRGVILVHAYVRGGGEKGEEWHKAGMKLNKPNTWKDFIACAEYLIKNKYTQSNKLACTGGSAGGVLIGRAITERPDLFAAAHIQSGSLNLTRAAAFANGVGNFGEYGDPNIEAEFNGLVAMDAVVQSKPNTKYPAIYITTGINDTRVSYWIPAKFAATMQANSNSNKPVLLHTNFEGGHFGDANAESLLSVLKTSLMADFFMLWQCGHKDFTMK
jgi:prolyl oligopeptidase